MDEVGRRREGTDYWGRVMKRKREVGSFYRGKKAGEVYEKQKRQRSCGVTQGALGPVK